MGALEILEVVTKNDVTLGSGGVGWTTGYQDYHKTYIGVARNTQNSVPGTLEASLRSPPFFSSKLPFFWIYGGLT